MNLALADASDIATPISWWLLIPAALIILALVVHHLATHSPVQDAEPSHLDALDGVGRCDQRLCTGLAYFPVTDEAGNSRRVCSACFELGWRLGWWVSFADKRPYDQEASA